MKPTAGDYAVMLAGLDENELSQIVAQIVAWERSDALREAAADPSLRLSGHSGISVRRLRERADRRATR